MQIQLNLDSSNQEDMEYLFNLLSGFGSDKPSTVPDDKTVVETDQRIAVLDKPVVEPAPEQPKRTRRTKAEIEAAKAEEAANNPAPQPAAQPATTIPPATEQPAASISIDDLRAALQGYTSAKGMPAGIELLKKFGCSRISELAAKDEATKRWFLREATV
jgi:hypothetical protein